MQYSGSTPFSPAEMAGSQICTQSTPAASLAVSDATGNGNTPPTCFAFRIQSGRLHDDDSFLTILEMDHLLTSDLLGRITEVGDGIAAELFPDSAFGFPINDQLVKNFCGSFISSSKLIDPNNFKTEEETAIFLNRMTTTIAEFLRSTGKTSLVPLRYFSDRQASTPMSGHPAKVKPDIVLTPLINGCIRDGPIKWKDVKSLVELTREKSPPRRMAKTVSVKSYMTFGSQPDRDFIPFLCITGKGIHIVVTDHVGQIETDVIPFDRTATTLIFFRMVMGLTFLPDSNLGLDTTFTRRDDGVPVPESNDGKFAKVYPPFNYNIPNPTVQLFLPDPSICVNPPAGTTTFNGDDGIGDNGIISISVNATTYRVIRLIFRAQTLVGRATRAFLVELPDGRLGVIKDSWITTNRATEASFLEGLDIPFGPQLINHCLLGNTSMFRDNPITPPSIPECREKRRVVTYPAGVHISDFSSLWELMVAMLDVVVGMIYIPFLFDHSSDFDILFQP